MTPLHRANFARGFTLLELLVVLAIAGLLVAAVPPMISAVIPGAEIKSASRELAVSLREAHFQAVSRGIAIDVTLTTKPAGYSIGDGPLQSLPRIAKLKVSSLPASATQTLENSPRSAEAFRLRFHPDGSSSGARILLSRGKHSYTVSVGWLMGRTTIRQGDAVDR